MAVAQTNINGHKCQQVLMLRKRCGKQQHTFRARTVNSEAMIAA